MTLDDGGKGFQPGAGGGGVLELAGHMGELGSETGGFLWVAGSGQPSLEFCCQAVEDGLLELRFGG